MHRATPPTTKAKATLDSGVGRAGGPDLISDLIPTPRHGVRAHHGDTRQARFVPATTLCNIWGKRFTLTRATMMPCNHLGLITTFTLSFFVLAFLFETVPQAAPCLRWGSRSVRVLLITTIATASIFWASKKPFTHSILFFFFWLTTAVTSGLCDVLPRQKSRSGGSCHLFLLSSCAPLRLLASMYVVHSTCSVIAPAGVRLIT